MSVYTDMDRQGEIRVSFMDSNGQTGMKPWIRNCNNNL